MTRVSNDKIVINPKELKARLGGADDSASKEFTDSVADEILSAMNCSYILKRPTSDLQKTVVIWALAILQAPISREILQAAAAHMCLRQL